MAGGEDEDGTAVHKPVFPPFPDDAPPPEHDTAAPAPAAPDPAPYPPAPPPPPAPRADPPASTADDPVTIPPAGQVYGEHMTEVLAKVGQEELAKTSQGEENFSFAGNLSTDPNMPVFMKRKRGRPRKHPLPEQRRAESAGRRVGRPPKSSASKVVPRKIKKEPVEDPMLVEHLLEEELAEHLPTEQSVAGDEDQEENAIRFTDVGNHLPLLVAGQHLCAVCLARHSHRQSSGVRRTRSTSFKRFTSVICRACNKFLCVTPRADGRTCFDVYHTLKDFIRADLPEFNRKECGDSDVISTEFDDRPDLTEDATMLLQLLQVASGEINKVTDFDCEEQKDTMETSLEMACTENDDSQTGVSKPDHLSSNHVTPANSSLGEESRGAEEDGEGLEEAVSRTLSGLPRPDVKDGQSQAITLLLKVLKNHRVLSVSETHQLRLERRPRKYNMANRNAHLAAGGTSPDDLTRRYRRKGRPRKHVSTDEEECDRLDEGGEDTVSNDGEGLINSYSDIITPGTRRKYACGRCHVEFNLIARMKVHLKAHVERKTYNCTICGVSFRTKGKLAEHRKQHKTEKTHKCPKCDESFKKMILLRRHMRTHQDIKPYECRICGSRFSYASSLKEHALNKHLGERPFKCSECDQGFIRQMNLLEHMRIHTGERPFKCPKCEQSFARKSGLKSHMISHTGEKKHMCSTCGARFRHKIALTEHQRTHTGEKPFVCQHCGQRFAASTTLRNHVRLHTGEKPHTCKVCGAGFAQRTSLNCHMKKHGIAQPENKAPRNNWTKNFKQSQPTEQSAGQESQHQGVGGGPVAGDHRTPDLPATPIHHHHHHHHQQHHHHQGAPPEQLTPQPHDYSDKSQLQPQGSGQSDVMMAQAVSMAFSKMVPDMLPSSHMTLSRRADAGPSPVPNTSQSHSMSHHQMVPQSTHPGMAPSPHAALHAGPGHVSSQSSNHVRSSASLLHSDLHPELERPSSHSNHGNTDVKPMQLSATGSPWTQDANLPPAFPFDPAFHPQMTQSFPAMLPGQASHGHGYPEQPRFPFDNRFGMADAWPAHANWKHKYQ